MRHAFRIRPPVETVNQDRYRGCMMDRGSASAPAQ